MGFQEMVDCTLEHERVVDCDVMDLSEALDIMDAVPTRLTAPRDGTIHHVIRDEEEGL